MAMTFTEPGSITEPTQTLTQRQKLFVWLLVIPMLFFAAHGQFSFEGVGDVSVATAQATVSAPVTHEHSIAGLALATISYSIILGSLLFNLRGIIGIARQNKMLTILPLLAIVSAVWSQSPSKSVTAGSFLLVSTLFAYMLVLRFSAEELMDQVMRVGVAVCFFGAIMVFLLPYYGVNNSDPRTLGAWVGIFSDRTAAAKCEVFLLSPALLYTARRSRWRNLIYTAVLLVFIVMARAVTALGVTASLVAIMVMVQAARRLERKTALFLGTIVGLTCLTFVVFGDTLLAPILALLGRNMTLTGRTDIWSALMVSIAKRPLLGYGFYAFWLGMEGESASVIAQAHWFFGYAHNGLLEIIVQLGFVGAAIFLGTFMWACKNAWFCFKYGRTAGAEWYFGILVLTLLYNVDEETVMWPNDLLSILYIVACCGLAMEAKKIRATHRVFQTSDIYASDAVAVAS